MFLKNGRTNDELYNFALKNGFRPQHYDNRKKALYWFLIK